MKEKNKLKRKVVIIGAGVSGLAAANRLIQNNLQDVIVLEAMDRIGGRVHYTHLEDNKGGVDLGAHWIHSRQNNVIYELAKPMELIQPSGDWQNPQLFFPGGRQAEFGDSNFFELFDDMITGLVDVSSTSFDNYEKIIAHKVDKILAPLNISNEDLDSIQRHISKNICLHEACDDVSDISVKHHIYCSESDVAIEWTKEGMNNILDILMGTHEKSPWKGLNVESRVKLSTKVTKIDWSGDQVEVTTDKGDTFIADYVIFTPSLNVLKHMHKKVFNPSLPHDKVSVIEKLGMDVVDKIYIVFDDIWWPSNVTGFGLLHDKIYPTETKDWGDDIVIFASEHHNPNVLCGWLVGDAAIQMEKETDEQVKDTVMRALRKYLPPSYDVPEPTQIIRSRWWENENIRGSYSFNHRNSDKIDQPRMILGKPLYNRLNKPAVLFAGEATSITNYATVHGAIETGWREADKIIKYSKME